MIRNALRTTLAALAIAALAAMSAQAQTKILMESYAKDPSDRARLTTAILTTVPEGIKISAVALDPVGIRTVTIRANSVDLQVCPEVLCTYVWKKELMRAGANANGLYINVVDKLGKRWNIFTYLTRPQ